MAWTFEAGLAIGLAYGIFATVYMGVTALRVNDEWADACARLDREWQQLCARIVMENYRKHVIEGR